MPSFPHLTRATEYPGAGRELYEQISGSFDYSLWTEGATLTLLSVPWGVYDAATMTDRPGFDTVAARDAWFAQHIADTTTESHTLDTRVRYQISDYIEVPFTFDYAARYNYLIVDYPTAPVPTGADGLRRWFYHITDIRYNSPSSTTLLLVPDWWTTAAPLMNISHMILMRGHAPMSLTTVDQFLAAPLANSDSLLAADIDFGTSTKRVAAHADTVFNSGTMYAVICLNGVDITGAFGAYGPLPFDNSTIVQGVPSAYQFAVAAADLASFLDAWATQAPQAMQALGALYLCSERLLAFTNTAQLWGFTIRLGVAGTTLTSTLQLNKAAFGYPSHVADLAKLYTWPYAHIELADERGNVTEIHIEELSTGTLTIEAALNGAFPWLNISAHVSGLAGARNSISFATAQAHEFGAGGAWYDTLKNWQVPCYSIHQSAAQAYDYRTHWGRVQQAANAATARDNALASAANAKTNADNAADNMTANNLINTTANSDVTDTSNQYTNDTLEATIQKMVRDQQADEAASRKITNAQNEAIALTATLNTATSAAHAATGLVTSAIGGDLTALNAGGAIADTVIGGISANAASTISQGTNTDCTNAAIANARAKSSYAQSYTEIAVDNQVAAASDITDIRNNAATQNTANNVNLAKTTATNNKTTSDNNTNRSYNNSIAAITNAVNEAALGAPLTFGASQGGEFANTRPMILSANIVTESKSAIAQAGAQFLRWGYAYNDIWDWATWNTRPHYTYWQVSDLWATGVGSVPEEAQDAVRRMLYDGVTCWADPDEIGRVSIYE